MNLKRYVQILALIGTAIWATTFSALSILADMSITDRLVAANLAVAICMTAITILNLSRS